ncbi:uncharacterized protein BT62DRAFT_1076209 [Guyanagaster necrorhizus]|uniref:Uncharacterized protein n=1 Tax=Guyanagaster necrorhizus TaxID=856835 RepID=A0A9P7VV17_9AGAR|nr:uncharacterized protein BT62DRAFT_1076209 [Guyanagaster necrorhizus MCA 3950]KAG7446669.1 hypothetical protein BT62DRAFT_1076209 [Guyanagaster necrorhizus MCA 3950]
MLITSPRPRAQFDLYGCSTSHSSVFSEIFPVNYPFHRTLRSVPPSEAQACSDALSEPLSTNEVNNIQPYSPRTSRIISASLQGLYSVSHNFLTATSLELEIFNSGNSARALIAFSLLRGFYFFEARGPPVETSVQMSNVVPCQWTGGTPREALLFFFPLTTLTLPTVAYAFP